MEVLDRIFDFKLDSDNKEYILETLEEYKKYLNALKIDTRKELFLDTLRVNEIIHNNEMEHEDAFMIQMELFNYEDMRKKTSLDVLTDLTLKGKNLTARDVEKIHRLLIHGTSDDTETNYYYRDFDTYVHEIVDGQSRVQYVAPSPTEITGYMKSILSFINSYKNCSEQDIFYKSILEHFYIAALQPFGNGNTRLARIMEYNEIFKLTRETVDSSLKEPTLYLSKNYMLTRGSYRGNIARFVQNPNDENFNRWYRYNLNAINEQLYFCNNQLARRRY